MKRLKLLQDRVEKILGEVAEARQDAARGVVKLFAGENDRVAAAEILAHADAMDGHKFRSAIAALKQMAGAIPTRGDFINLYIRLGLRPSGAERG